MNDPIQRLRSSIFHGQLNGMELDDNFLKVFNKTGRFILFEENDGGISNLKIIDQINKILKVLHWNMNMIYCYKSTKVAGSIPTVVRQIFQLARCGYTLSGVTTA